jgi:hypothetical protein
MANKSLVEILHTRTDCATFLMPAINRTDVLAMRARYDARIAEIPKLFGNQLAVMVAPKPDIQDYTSFGIIFAFTIQEILERVAAVQIKDDPGDSLDVAHAVFLVHYCVHALGQFYNGHRMYHPQLFGVEQLPASAEIDGMKHAAPFVGLAFVRREGAREGHYVAVYARTATEITVYEPLADHVAMSVTDMRTTLESRGWRVTIVPGQQGGSKDEQNICGYIAAYYTAWCAMSHNAPPPFKLEYLVSLKKALRNAHEIGKVVAR